MLNDSSNITSGKVFSSVIENERKGEYLGLTVQMVPHITNEINAKYIIPTRINMEYGLKSMLNDIEMTG